MTMQLTAVFDAAPAGNYCWARRAYDALLELKTLLDASIWSTTGRAFDGIGVRDR